MTNIINKKINNRQMKTTQMKIMNMNRALNMVMKMKTRKIQNLVKKKRNF